MYEDFEDLRDNCPAEIEANIAVDFLHDDLEHLANVWPATGDGEFRLALIQAVTDYWEGAVRDKGGETVPVDGFAIEILIDSFSDPDMGSSLYLELHAYCGTEEIGEICWSVFDDEPLAVAFEKTLTAAVPELLDKTAPGAGCGVRSN